MNKIFKVIWNHTTQSWVAVSELTKAHGKTKSVTTAAATVALLVSGSASAVSVVTGNDITGATNGDNKEVVIYGKDIAVGGGTSQADNTLIGSNITTKNSAEKNTVVGNHIVANTIQGTLIGHNVSISGTGSIGIGKDIAGANTSQDKNALIGNNITTTNGAHSNSVLGNDIYVNTVSGTLIGSNISGNAHNIVGIGKDIKISGSNSGIAIGNNVSSSEGALVLGTNANSTKDGVVIGRGAVNEYNYDTVIGIGAKSTLNAVTADKHDDVKGNNPPAVVIGFNANSSSIMGDVVIGAWAKSSFSALDRTFKIGQATAVGSRATVYGDQGTALGGDTLALGNSSIAIGGDDINLATKELVKYVPTADKYVAVYNDGIWDRASNVRRVNTLLAKLGKTNQASLIRPRQSNGVDGGYVQTTAAGDASTAIGPQAMTLGVGSQAFGVNPLALGHSSIAMGSFATAGRDADAGTNTIAIGSVSSALGDSSIAMGMDSLSHRRNDVAIGLRATAGFSNSPTMSDAAKSGLAELQKASQNGPYRADVLTSIQNAWNQLTPEVKAEINKFLDASIKSTMQNGWKVNSLSEEQLNASGVEAILAYADAIKGNEKAGDKYPDAGQFKKQLKALLEPKEVGADAIAVGRDANAIVTHGIAIGTGAQVGDVKDKTDTGINVQKTNGIAIGKGSVVKGNSSVAVGVDNLVTGDYSTTIGDPSIIEGKESHAQGNDNVISSATTGALVLGNRNRMGAKPTYTAEDNTAKVDNTKPLEGIAALGDQTLTVRDVSGSVAIGNDNTVTSKDTFILGSSINTHGAITTLGGTVENSVYLGKDSTAVAGAPDAPATLFNIKDDGTEGESTTGGDKGIVNNATVAGIDYQGFQGNKADGVVTVGSADHERRIQNVAAGEISATSTDAINGSQLYLITKAIGDVSDNNPFSYSVKEGDKNVPVTQIDGKFYKDEDLADLKYDPTTQKFYDAKTGKVAPDPKEVPADTVNISSAVDGETDSPSTVNNVKGNLPATYNDGDLKQDDDTTKLTNERAPEVTKSQKLPDNFNLTAKYNNAATVGDVLNAGWNLQGNGIAKDFVKPYDTVNFADGTGTTVEVETSADGKLSTIKVNTATQYTDSKGTPVTVIDGKGYAAGAIKGPDGKVYPKGTTFDENNMPKDDKGAPVTALTPLTNNPQISLVNGDKTSTTPTVLGNVAQGANTITNLKDANNKPLVKVGDKYYKAEDLTNGTPNANAVPLIEKDGKYYTPDQFGADGNLKPNPTETAVTPVSTKAADEARVGLADLNNSNPSNALTVADAKNLGWVVSSDKTTGDLGKEYADDVRNANEVRFVGTGLATVSGKTDDSTGVRTITVDVNAQTVAETAQLPVVYTDKDGNKLIKGDDGKFYPADSVKIDGKYYPKDSVLAKDGKVYPADKVDKDGNVITNNGADAPKAVDPVEPTKNGDVIASMNNGNNESKDAPMNLANLRGNLPQTVNVGDTPEKVGADGKTTGELNKDPATKPAPARTERQEAPDNIGDIYNNAATVGDVLNSGWNLGINGDKKDFVKAYDTVNFVNGNGTLASVETNEKGDVSNVTFNIDKGEITPDENTGVLKGADIEALKKEAKDAADAIEPAKKVVETRKEELEAAKTALETSPESPEMKKKLADAEQALKDAEADLANKESLKVKADKNVAAVPNKVATVENVVEAVNKSGFTIYQDEATADNKKALVNPGDKVVYAAEGLATVTVDQETADGVTKITYKVDAQAVAETAQLPVVYTDKDGNKLIKGDDGKFYPADSVKIDGKYYPKGSTKGNDGVVKKDGKPATELTAKETGDVIASMNNGNNESKDAPMNLANLKGNLTPTYNKDDLKEGGTDEKPNGKLTDTESPSYTKTAEARSSEDMKKVYNNAATVGDVLNAGWNLRNNGKEKDFVKPYDTVNFVDGIGTTVEVETLANGKVSNIKVNTATQYTDAAGNPLQKIGDSYYPQDVVIAKDGKVYPKDTEFKDDGSTPKVDGTKEAAPISNPQISLVNADGKSTTPTVLGNVAQGANTITNLKDANNKPLVKVGDKYYKAEELENGAPKADAVGLTENKGKFYTPDQFDTDGNLKPDAKETALTPVSTKPADEAKVGLADLEKSNPNNALTVADAKNLGWVVSSDKTTGDLGKEYADDVRNTNEVKFVGKNGVTVSGKTDGEGVRTITVELEKGEVISSNAENPFVTNQDGSTTPVTKVGDQYFNTDDIKDGIVKVTTPDGKDKYYKVADVTIDDKGVAKPKDNVTALTPIASDKVTSGNAGAGFVTGNQVGDAIQASGWTVGKATKEELAAVNDKFSAEAGPDKVEKVNPDDNLRFADGKGIKVSLGTVKAVDKDGVIKTTTTVKVDIDAGELENNPDGSVKDIADPAKLEALRDAEKKVADANQKIKDAEKAKADAAQAVVDAEKAKTDAEQAVKDAEKALADNQDPAKKDELQKALDAAKEKAKDPALAEAVKVAKEKAQDPALDKAIETAKKEAAKPELAEAVKDAKAELAKDSEANKVATAQNVADAINKSGFTLKTSAADGGEKVSGEDELINPGKTVEMVAGKNMTVKQDKDGKITYATKDKVEFTEVTVKDAAGNSVVTNGTGITINNGAAGNPVSLTQNGLDNGGNKITNVAAGEADTDAVNVKQLKDAVSNINNGVGDIHNRVNKLDHSLRAGIAGANAAAGLPQVYIPGKSMVAASVGTYKGQSAVAVGYSRSSDNGKVILKLQGNANTRGDFGGSVGIGYQW